MTEPKRIGKYEMIEELGHGGFATVYRARDTQMGREVALKVIAGNFAQEPAFTERFRQEALTAASLRHPRIVTVYDFGDADGTLYLAMALIGAGRTLRDLLAEQAPLSLEQALPILAQLADALDYLHRHDPPLTHRDVKPANALLEGEGDKLEIVLTDFGLVRSMEASTELTRSGTILGTLAYMAPEQANPKLGQMGSAADLYALGVVAYEMLTGRVPFEGEAATLLHAHAYEVPPSPLELVPDLGDDLSEALLRALAKSPAGRYPSAGAFVVALREVANARTVAAEREATLEQLETQARKLLKAGEWLEALDCCTQMVRLDPDRPAALEMLTTAKQGLDRERAEAVARRRLEERYTEGLNLLKEGKWKQAIAALEEVAAGNPDFREVQDKLAQARDELQRAQWYDEAIAHADAERWPEACRTWVKVLRGRFDYRDGDAASRLLNATDKLLSQHDVEKRAKHRGDWERLLLMSAHSKRSGSLNKATRRFIGQLSKECAEKQDATPLLTALDNPDCQVRRFAAKVLGELGGRFDIDQKTVVPRLIQAITEDEDIGTRWRAVWALGALRPSSYSGQVRDLLYRLLEEKKESHTVRWRAAWALGETKAGDAVGLLAGVARDAKEVESVRRAAIRALGAIQSPEAEWALGEITKHEVGKLSELASWALQEIATRKR
jgi:tetratricopeptide (TPR) repeat protein